jgi:hypothetical protein
MNAKILTDNNKIIKRVFNLDTNAYQAGALMLRPKNYWGWLHRPY